MKRDPQKTGATGRGVRLGVLLGSKVVGGLKGRVRGGPKKCTNVLGNEGNLPTIMEIQRQRAKLGGGLFKYFLEFSPRKLGEYFFKWLGSTTNWRRSLEGNLRTIMEFQA